MNKFIIVNPVVALVSVTIFFCACMESREKQIERLVNTGYQSFVNHQYKDAVGSWVQAMELAPENASIYENLGHACLRLARFDDAERYFGKAVQLRPEAWDIWIEIGKLNVLSLDLKGAEDVWEKLKTQGTNNRHTFIYHGDLAMLKNEFREAELDYRQALAIAPNQEDGMIKLVIALQVQGKKEEAETIYEQLAAKTVNDPFVWIQMGHYWNLADDFSNAEICMGKALALDPADLRIQIRVANFYTAAGEFSKAAMILEPILKEASLAVSKEYANLLIQQYKIADALLFLKPLLIEHPDDDSLRLLTGKCHLLSGNPALAISEINAVEEKHPDSPAVHYLLGVAYLAGGYNKTGIQNLTKALALDNSFSEAELALAACYYKTGEYGLAREHAQRVMQNEPANFSSYMLVGAADLDEGNYADAKRMFAIAANLNPDSPSPLYFSAMADDYAGRTDQAKKQYEHLLALEPIKIDILEQYIALLVKSGQNDIARRFLEEKSAQDPDNAYLHYMLGDFYASGQKPDLATQAFKKAVDINPSLTLAYLRLANLCQDNGKIADAIEILKNAVAMNSTFTEGLQRLAQLYCLSGKHQEAIDALESAYAVDRDDATVINNLATLYLEDDTKLLKAFELAQKAYEKNNTEPAFIDTLGWAYYKKGLFSQAAWYLKEAEKNIFLGSESVGETGAPNGDVSPADFERVAIVNYHLGMALVKSGDEKIGFEKIKKALELGLEGKMQEDARLAVRGEG